MSTGACDKFYKFVKNTQILRSINVILKWLRMPILMIMRLLLIKYQNYHNQVYMIYLSVLTLSSPKIWWITILWAKMLSIFTFVGVPHDNLVKSKIDLVLSVNQMIFLYFLKD